MKKNQKASNEFSTMFRSLVAALLVAMAGGCYSKQEMDDAEEKVRTSERVEANERLRDAVQQTEARVRAETTLDTIARYKDEWISEGRRIEQGQITKEHIRTVNGLYAVSTLAVLESCIIGFWIFTRLKSGHRFPSDWTKAGSFVGLEINGSLPERRTLNRQLQNSRPRAIAQISKR